MLQQTAPQYIPEITAKPKQEYISDTTLQLIKQRREPFEAERSSETHALDKPITQGKRKDKTETIIKTLDIPI